MELVLQIIDIVLHLDRHLGGLIQDFGPWFYAIIFLVIFCETGLVVTPFLPGDSLLFALGTFAAIPNGLNLAALLVLIPVAAILGDTVNYWIGRSTGHKLALKFPRVVKKEYLDRTHKFYERYGAKTIVIARFVPIVRTFAPFVAGVGEMSYPRFMAFNVLGGIIWAVTLVPLGYFLARHDFVKKRFSTVILMIIIISILPGVFEFLRERKRLKMEKASAK